MVTKELHGGFCLLVPCLCERSAFKPGLGELQAKLCEAQLSRRKSSRTIHHSTLGPRRKHNMQTYIAAGIGALVLGLFLGYPWGYKKQEQEPKGRFAATWGIGVFVTLVCLGAALFALGITTVVGWLSGAAAAAVINAIVGGVTHRKMTLNVIWGIVVIAALAGTLSGADAKVQAYMSRDLVSDNVVAVGHTSVMSPDGTKIFIATFQLQNRPKPVWVAEGEMKICRYVKEKDAIRYRCTEQGRLLKIVDETVKAALEDDSAD